jgi:hypothetical protein
VEERRAEGRKDERNGGKRHMRSQKPHKQLTQVTSINIPFQPRLLRARPIKTQNSSSDSRVVTHTNKDIREHDRPFRLGPRKEHLFFRHPAKAPCRGFDRLVNGPSRVVSEWPVGSRLVVYLFCRGKEEGEVGSISSEYNKKYEE